MARPTNDQREADAQRSAELAPIAAKALAHPTRVLIVDYLSEHGSGSPSEISLAVGETGPSLGTISYHVRQLASDEFQNFIILDHTTPRRGALEHHYRLHSDSFHALAGLVGFSRAVLKASGH
jgi:DNA-binding transcriptional ArsR family regulator